MQQWCESNKMVVNTAKTNYVNFDQNHFEFCSSVKYHKLDCNHNTNCECPILDKVDNFNYLGVYLDQNLSWKTHLSNLQNQLKLSVRKFYYLRNFCDKNLLRTLYYGLVHSRPQYGIVCWGGAFKSYINQLRKTQNTFVRIILKKRKRDSSFPLYRNLNLLPLEHLFAFKTLRLFYTLCGNRGNVRSHYDTRSNKKRIFFKPKANIFKFKQSFVYLGPDFFNRLPIELKEAYNLRVFCTKLKLFLLNSSTVFC